MDELTKCQILQIQGIDIVKFVFKVVGERKTDDESVQKMKKMFDIVHDKS